MQISLEPIYTRALCRAPKTYHHFVGRKLEPDRKGFGVLLLWSVSVKGQRAFLPREVDREVDRPSGALRSAYPRTAKVGCLAICGNRCTANSQCSKVAEAIFRDSSFSVPLSGVNLGVTPLDCCRGKLISGIAQAASF